MRISDWSSDVCSSDLFGGRRFGLFRRARADHQRIARPRPAPRQARSEIAGSAEHRDGGPTFTHTVLRWARIASSASAPGRIDAGAVNHAFRPGSRGRRGALSLLPRPQRSEEYTSELQSLMRISYAVFCLNKKKKK